MRTDNAGVDPVTKPETIGSVIVRPWKPGRVMLDFKLEDGSRQRPILSAVSRTSALAMATQVAAALEAQRVGLQTECPLDVVARLQGKLRPSEAAGPTIADALEEAIEIGSHAKDDWKAELRALVNLFIEWTEAKHPEIPDRWRFVSYSIVQEYMGTVGHLSKDRIAHRLAPIRLAARYWARKDPDQYRDVTLGVSLPEGKPRRGPLVLSPDELNALLDKLKQLQPSLYPIAALASFAGLRIREAAFLRLVDVDLKQGTLRVAETSLHKPKNAGSYRIIPLAPQALDVLKDHLGRLQPVDANAPLFLTAHGLPWIKKRLDDSWKRFRKLVRLANDEKEECDRYNIPEGYTLRGSRRSFVTISRKAGADRQLIRRYIGHAVSGDMLASHYDAVDQADLATVAAAFQRGFVNGLSTAGESCAQSQ